jgi:hypothetical protein
VLVTHFSRNHHSLCCDYTHPTGCFSSPSTNQLMA